MTTSNPRENTLCEGASSEHIKPEWPDTAPDDKAFMVLWADGRALAAFRHKQDAKAFIDDQDPTDVVWCHYTSPMRKVGPPSRRKWKRWTIRNSYKPKSKASMRGVNVLEHHPGNPRETIFHDEVGSGFSPPARTALRASLPIEEALSLRELDALDIMAERRGFDDEFWVTHRKQIKSAEFSPAFEQWMSDQGIPEGSRRNAWFRYLDEKQEQEKTMAQQTEDREMNPDGTMSCGVFIPLPYSLR